jgi:hypothetical protein
MSQVLLSLASDFMERMSNPAHGIRVNEDYALRFAALQSSDGFEELLRREIEQLEEPDTLSPHGWLWLLSWARSKNIPLNERLLFGLAESFSSVFMQVTIIDLATRWSKWQRRNVVTPLEGFDHHWLSALLRRCTSSQREEDPEPDEVDTMRAETVLVALMQVGSELTLDAASTLLNHRWAGQHQLVQFFLALCDGVDEETRDNWISRLRPPERLLGNEFHGR